MELLGRTLADVPYILMAEKAGAGTADYQRLNPVLINTKELKLIEMASNLDHLIFPPSSITG